MSVEVLADTEKLPVIEDQIQNENIAIHPGRKSTLRMIFATYTQVNETGDIQLLLRPQTVKSTKEDFLLASYITNCVENEDVEVRKTEQEMTPLIASEDVSVIALGYKSEHMVAVEKQAIEQDTQQLFNEIWNQADEVNFHVPGISTVKNSFVTRFSTELAEEFIDYMKGFYPEAGEQEISSVDIALLFAAEKELMFYDINRWGDFIGFASTATFSRKKRELEEKGLIETENEQVNLGRPRMKLFLANDIETIQSVKEYKEAIRRKENSQKRENKKENDEAEEFTQDVLEKNEDP